MILIKARERETHTRADPTGGHEAAGLGGSAR
jgi:hypothetical protein